MFGLYIFPKVYFAHPVSTYNTILEKMVIAHLERQGAHLLINPNTPEHQEGYKNEGMEYFKKIIEACDYVYVLPFPDDFSIGAGIAKEINWALEKGIKVVYLKPRFEHEEIFFLRGYNVLTVEETRDKLKSSFYE
jgi:hypothetical protein